MTGNPDLRPALAVGSRIGPYEVVGPLGVGGMGEVYRARDWRLKRDVALKVLPREFANDPVRMARFQREAEVLASLNHPGIAHIHGVEDSAIVMELVEGESPKGPLPLEDARRIALQIAEALEYAHERGIVHRDLKPANIRITPDGAVKLLDFGLARALSDPSSTGQGDPAVSPTMTFGATVAGTIIGTAASMAPEQAKGKTVDKRADIWAFGVVLFELLTGQQPFEGDNIADTLAHVLTKEPDLAKVPGPAQLLLRRCLEKDPKRRLRDIGETAFLLEAGSREVATGKANRVGWLWPAVAGLGFAIAAMLAVIHFRETQLVRARVRFQISAPEGKTFGVLSLSRSTVFSSASAFRTERRAERHGVVDTTEEADQCALQLHVHPRRA